VTGRLKRLRERDQDVLDRYLAALLFLVMAVDLAFGHRHGPLAAELLISAVISTAFLWRRKNALVMATVVLTGLGVLLTAETNPNDASSVIAVIIVAGYSVGAHLELRRSLFGLVLTAGTIALVCVLKTPNDVFFPVVFFGIVPWAVGRVIRTQTALARELAEKAEAEQLAREEEEARATAAERARVARELHDVLAHNLSVMVIQASAARRVLDREPTAAVEAAELISRTGREALTELRYVFGPVRRDDGDALASPGLANLDQLVSRAHRSGLPVEVRVEGKPLKLSPGADLAAYRVVQEALTNTLKHSHGSRAAVVVRYEPPNVVVEVVDDGVGTANGLRSGDGGHGLIGMRERMALYGGTLEAGTRPEGGFRVLARVPLEGRLT
jgi:signal transduction histidine kinase